MRHGLNFVGNDDFNYIRYANEGYLWNVFNLPSNGKGIYLYVGNYAETDVMSVCGTMRDMDNEDLKAVFWNPDKSEGIVVNFDEARKNTYHIKNTLKQGDGVRFVFFDNMDWEDVQDLTEVYGLTFSKVKTDCFKDMCKLIEDKLQTGGGCVVEGYLSNKMQKMKARLDRQSFSDRFYKVVINNEDLLMVKLGNEYSKR